IGSPIERTSRFFVRRKSSMTITAFTMIAVYVTPQRIAGRVRPTANGSSTNPGLRSLMARYSDSEHTAHPLDDLRRPEEDADPAKRCERPSPRDSACHCNDAKYHHDEDGDRRRDRDEICDERGGPRVERRLGECIRA